MDRRRFLGNSMYMGAVGLPSLSATQAPVGNKRPDAAAVPSSRQELVRVAFPVSNSATVIDFAGPWEVFQDVMLGDPDDHSSHRRGFEMAIVGPTRDPIRVSGGMTVVPDFSVFDAPTPDVVVVAAQDGSPEITDWIVAAHASADLTMSVCTGAFILARAGLLDGLEATTHHDFWGRFEREFPAIHLRKDRLRYIDHGRVATAGGLTSGIDLALHVVERYYGRETAERTADYLEYESRGWRNGA